MHPEQKYTSLGGWLLGFFVYTIISLVFSLSYIMLFSLIDGFSASLTSYYSTTSTIVPPSTYIIQFLTGGLQVLLLIFIGTRNRNFLWVYMLFALVSVGSGIYAVYQLTSISYWGEFFLPFGISSAVFGLAYHISWLVYFVRSRRVYVYMRNDEYLKRSLLFANVKRPEPAPYIPPQYPAANPYGAQYQQPGYYGQLPYGTPPQPGYGAPAYPPQYPQQQPPYTPPAGQPFTPPQSTTPGQQQPPYGQGQ